MPSQSNASKMMQAFSGQTRMLTTPVAYVDFMGGSHAGGTFLSQLIFWSDKGGKKDGWFYKSYKEWHDEVRLSRHHVNKFSQALVEAGVLETQLRKANGFPTLHYKLDMERLTIAFCEFLQKGDEGDLQGFDIQKVANPFVNFRKTITEDYIQNTEGEILSRRKNGGLSEISPTPPQDNVSPLSVSELEPALPDGNALLSSDASNSVYTQDAPDAPLSLDGPALAELFLADTPPVPIKDKEENKVVAASAAVVSPPKPPKEPKPPREMNERDLAFLAKIEQLNPLIALDVKKRLGMYRRSNPWSVTQVFLLTGIWPNKNNWASITSLNGVEFDTEKLVLCLNAWTAKGWSPKNLDWIFNWYVAGGPPKYTPKYSNGSASSGSNGNIATYAPVQESPAPAKAELDYDDPAVLDFVAWLQQPEGKYCRYGGDYAVTLAVHSFLNGKYCPRIGIEKMHAEYLADRSSGLWAS